VPGTAVYGSPDGIVDSSAQFQVLELDAAPTIPVQIFADEEEGVVSSAPPLAEFGRRPVTPAPSAPAVRRVETKAGAASPALTAPGGTPESPAPAAPGTAGSPPNSAPWGWSAPRADTTAPRPVAPSSRRPMRDMALVALGAAVIVVLAYLIGVTV
jgi:hypothetical protein